MRLSLKSVRLFVVLATLAGSLFAFSPEASAHKRTNSVAAVQGAVTWPLLPKVGSLGRPPALPMGFDLDNRGPDNYGGTNLSLNLRAGNPSSPLNGCRLKGGNSAEGLPVGHSGKVTPPTPAQTYTSHDLCFAFGRLLIASDGLWDGLNQATNFDCIASGTTGASGNAKGDPMPTALAPGQNVGLPPVTFGAFYGEFTCNGVPVKTPPVFTGKEWVPTADGHFHGLSIGSTTIGFLGEIHCTQPAPNPLIGGTLQCPKDNAINLTRVVNGGHTTPATMSGLTARDAAGNALADQDQLSNHNTSRIKHTLKCKGEVVPLVPGFRKYSNDADPDGSWGNPVTDNVGDSITTANVALTCIIA